MNSRNLFNNLSTRSLNYFFETFLQIPTDYGDDDNDNDNYNDNNNDNDDNDGNDGNNDNDNDNYNDNNNDSDDSDDNDGSDAAADDEDEDTQREAAYQSYLTKITGQVSAWNGKQKTKK